MPEIKKCPICGSDMTVFEENIWKRLRCSKCPLDFGRYWFENLATLVSAWNDFVSPEAARESSKVMYHRGETAKQNTYEKLFYRR